MKRTYKHSMMALMLLCSFAFLSCNNKKANSETTNVESVDTMTADAEYSDAGDPAIDEELDNLQSQLGDLGQNVQDELRDEGDISVYTGQEIMNCDGAVTTLGEKINQMTPDQRQRYQELKDAITKMAKALNLYE
ncbi:MAG: hypothetical protein J1E57_07800 [Prevotella sp.]|nr:hypothetical protein [Prevotella sp.]